MLRGGNRELRPHHLVEEHIKRRISREVDSSRAGRRVTAPSNRTEEPRCAMYWYSCIPFGFSLDLFILFVSDSFTSSSHAIW